MLAQHSSVPYFLKIILIIMFAKRRRVNTMVAPAKKKKIRNFRDKMFSLQLTKQGAGGGLSVTLEYHVNQG